MLSSQGIDQYREEGYCLVENVLDEMTRARMKQVLAEILDGARRVSDHTDIYDLEPSHTPADPRVRRIKRPHKLNAVFWDFLRSPVLQDALIKLLGPNVRLHGSKLNLKAPHYGSPVEWHQDWPFYPHTNDDLLAIGVMLDDCTVENGAMLVLPGTHKGPTYDHHGPDGYFCGAMDPTACDLDFSKAVAVTGPAGAASFHHVRLVHGSAQNTSAKPRPLLLYEAGAADAYPLMGPGDYADFHGRIIAGEDTIVPRFVPCPIRMPLPPAKNQGSIYENQSQAASRYFEIRDVPAKATT